jgi:hypothetical protein
MANRKPPNPHLVLLVSLFLPGSGQVWNGQPYRGLVFIFFMLLLGGFTAKTAAPDVSAIGKYSGAIFVWAMSVLDAYKLARVRSTVWKHGSGKE